MSVHKNPRAMAFVVLTLLLVSAVPAVQAVEHWLRLCHYTGNWCGPDGDWSPSTAQTLPFGDRDGTILRTTWPFQIERAYEFVVVGAVICECAGLLDENENVEVHVEGPGGRVYGPWHLTYDEPCHQCHEWSPDPGPGGGEDIVMVSPPQGTYTLVLEPGPGRSRLPDNSNVVVGAVLAFFEHENSPRLGQDRIWWYYPNGSKVFVEEGSFVPVKAVSEPFARYASVALGLWVLAAVAAYRAWRLIDHGSRR